MNREELIALMEQPDKHGGPRELYRGCHPTWGVTVGTKIRWFVTYGNSGDVEDELIKELIKEKVLFPTYIHSSDCYWLKPFSIDLNASRIARETGQVHPMVLIVVDAITGQRFPWRDTFDLVNHLRGKKRGKLHSVTLLKFPRSRITTRQQQAAHLFELHKSYVKVAEILGCTRQNVESLLKRAGVRKKVAQG